jgi:2-aminoadipate transaminase
MLTTGSQQGIDLCGKVFINPGDNVWVENPTYLAAIQIYKVYNACFNTVITDKDGMDIDALKQGAAENGGKLVYTVPTFQNPTGKSLSLERRKAIIECLEDNDMILVEDDPYSDLRYEGEVLPPIKSFDTSGRVVYLGSFSKTIAPGLRTGYIVANEEILAKMMVGKQTVDLHSNALSQVLIYEYLKSETYDAHLESIKLLYKNKRDKMLNLMQAHFPDCAKWEKPQGGMFIWVEFPQGVSMTEFLSVAMDEKIAFIPGASFYALGGTDNTMRLNFSNSTEADMEKGIKKLGELLKKLFNK